MGHTDSYCCNMPNCRFVFHIVGQLCLNLCCVCMIPFHQIFVVMYYVRRLTCRDRALDFVEIKAKGSLVY